MRESIFSILIVLLIIAVLVAALLGLSFLRNRQQGTVFIDGKTVDVPLYFDPLEQHIHVPLLAMLKQLGYTFSLQDNGTVLIEKDGNQYTLDIRNRSLSPVGEEDDYLMMAPGGGYYYCEASEDDLVVDITTFHTAICLMDSHYRIRYNSSFKLVFIGRDP